MAKESRNLNFHLIRVNRLTAWFLLFMVLTYLCTGLALCGKLRFDRLIQTERALSLHKSLVWPLTALFVSHTAISVYFAFRRWGWIGKRTKT
jgi:hypothetical protein